MKTCLLFLLLLCTFASKADTIATWNVYYNQKLLRQFNANPGAKEIRLNASHYKKGDYLSIKYGDDTPCHECAYELTVSAEGKDAVFKLNAKDKYKLMKIDLSALLARYKTNKRSTLFVVYLTSVDRTGKRDLGMRLFSIKME